MLYETNAQDIAKKIEELLEDVRGLENWAIGLDDLEDAKKWRAIYNDLIAVEFNL